VRCRLNTPATAGAVLRLEEPAAAETAAPTGEPAAFERAYAGERAVAGEQLSLSVDGAPSSIRDDAGADRRVDTIATLSYTSLSELERCGYRYYLERILGLPEDRAAARVASEHKGLDARARGTLIHRLMEKLDFAGPRPVSPERVAALARELGLRVGRAEREEVAALVVAASTAAPAARVAAARSVRREHPFAFSLGRHLPLITGVIDVLASESDGVELVVDYKSDRVGAEVDLEALVQREYGVQRLLYALAVLRGGAAGVEIVHWFLERPGEWVSVAYIASERGELEARLRARLTGARARDFSVSPRPHRALCLTCPGRGGLCSWSESETLRERPEPDQQAGGARSERR
jgi:ATP-dependent helicase/nuclease subunit A